MIRRSSLRLMTLWSALSIGVATGCAHGRTDQASGVIAPAAAARELNDEEQARQALSRLAFGPRPGDVERVRAMGVDHWIAQQLAPEKIRDDSTSVFLARLPTLSLTSRELVERNPRPMPFAGVRDTIAERRAAEGVRRAVTELQIAKVGRAVISERQLQEVMVDFWASHFNVFAGKGADRYLIGEYDRDVIRPNALGHFRDLLGAVAKSPAMLFYLDNWESSVEPGRPALVPPGGRRFMARNPNFMPPPATPPDSTPAAAKRRPRGLNENYARELMELHTLGVDGGYTQQDVINVARALTGWSVEQPRQGGGFVFRPRLHDAGEKVVLGHHLPAGRGIEDGEEVLDLLARHPSTAHFIATKLARRFVSDSPPPALVARAAEVFQRSNGDIRATVKVIVTSPEFFSRMAYRAKVKSPFELVASGLRAVGATVDTTPRSARMVARLGEPLFGHQAPNGYPDEGAAWINSGSILDRINFGLALASGGVPGASLERWPAVQSLATAPREEQVDGVVRELLGSEVSEETRRVLTTGVNPLIPSDADSVATGARQPMSADAERATMDSEMAAGDARSKGAKGGRRADPLRVRRQPEGLAAIVGLALGAPEFQRR
jgi:uncharacterized protein (DUF1800 family)